MILTSSSQMVEAVALLRRLALAILEEILVENRPDLSPGQLGSDQFSTLQTTGIWGAWIPRFLRPSLVRAHNRYQIKYAPSRLRAFSIWRRGFERELALHLNLEIGLADELWPVAAEAAWQELGLRYEMAKRVHDYFKVRCLVDDPPHPNLSSRTFWLLIYLATTKPVRWQGWFRFSQRKARRLLKRLQRLGRLHGLTPGWAGFWDQWLLVEATRRLPRPNVLDPVNQAVGSLPLVKLVQPRVMPESQDEKNRAKTLRARLQRLMVIIRDWARASHRQVPTVDLALPDWREDLPAWFPLPERPPRPDPK